MGTGDVAVIPSSLHGRRKLLFGGILPWERLLGADVGKDKSSPLS